MTDPSSIDPGGLHLLDADSVTPAELERFRAYYARTKQSQNHSYDFWLEFRPDVLKRHKARTVQWHTSGASACAALTQLHEYVIEAFADGIDYETRLAQTLGAKKTDVLDVLSIAFIHSGHRGMYVVADTMSECLRHYEDKEGPRFPSHWEFDPSAFRSGMDYSRLSASPADVEALKDWYLRTIGEVPRHVAFLGEHRPDLLKAYRNRYEHAIRDSLPKQMMPFLHLHYNVVRGFGPAIRENVLLAKAFGMTKGEVLDAILSAVLHCGANGLDLVDEVAGDLLATFDD